MEVREEPKRIRIVLIDRHGLLRSSLARLLSLEPDLEVAGEFGNEDDALHLLRDAAVDLVLMDFNIGADHANRFIWSARTGGYQGRFLIVTATAEPESVATALHSGSSGIFLKSQPPERLIQAIRFVQAGSAWIDLETLWLLADHCVNRATRIPARGPDPFLDEREQQALNGIVAGLTNRAIGADMGVPETSVKNILQRLFAKAGVRTRSQLVRLAVEGSFGTAARLRKAGRDLTRKKPPDTVEHTVEGLAR